MSLRPSSPPPCWLVGDETHFIRFPPSLSSFSLFLSLSLFLLLGRQRQDAKIFLLLICCWDSCGNLKILAEICRKDMGKNKNVGKKLCGIFGLCLYPNAIFCGQNNTRVGQPCFSRYCYDNIYPKPKNEKKIIRIHRIESHSRFFPFPIAHKTVSLLLIG